MNRLVDMLEESEVETKVTRFSSKEGIVGLGESPFVSFQKFFYSIMFINLMWLQIIMSLILISRPFSKISHSIQQ